MTISKSLGIFNFFRILYFLDSTDLTVELVIRAISLVVKFSFNNEITSYSAGMRFGIKLSILVVKLGNILQTLSKIQRGLQKLILKAQLIFELQ